MPSAVFALIFLHKRLRGVTRVFQMLLSVFHVGNPLGSTVWGTGIFLVGPETAELMSCGGTVALINPRFVYHEQDIGVLYCLLIEGVNGSSVLD